MLTRSGGTVIYYTPAPGQSSQQLFGSGTLSTTNAQSQYGPGTHVGTFDIAQGAATTGRDTTNTYNLTVTVVSPPTVSNITPASGTAAGGTSVTISGANFTASGNAVTFGGAAATVTAQSSTSITVTAPAHAAGVAAVVVTTADGETATSGTGYTYVTPPTVTSVAPTAGTTGGGNSVVITGTSFSGTTAVQFGGAAATSFVVNSNTQITATAPAGAVGTVAVRVTNSGGGSSTTAGAGNSYTYVLPPTVQSANPPTGPPSGGTSVVITGTNFTGATLVTFNGTSAQSFTVNSATQITAVTPSGSGAVAIAVRTAGGVSTLANGYTYAAAPTIASVAPNSGPTAGGATVTINGTNLAGATTVTFGGAPAQSYTVDSPTQITAVAPAGAAGAVNVAVGTPGGTATATNAYIYVAAPTVGSVSPAQGTTAGGATVTITGAGFTGATAVAFGGTPAASFTVNSPTQITAVTPAQAAGAVPVMVTNASGTSASGVTYTYVTPPTADNQSVTTTYQTAVAITLTASNMPTSYAVTTAPAHGTLSGAAPNLTYTPTVGYSGPDSFQFTATNAGGTSAPATVSITVSPPAPVANAQSVSTAADTAKAITLTASNTPTSYAVTTTPAHGTLSGAAPNLTYTPTAGYGGPDSFQFTATNAGGTSAPATVSITVSPLAPVANAQSVTTPTGVATAVTLTASNAPTSYAVTTTPAHGTLSGAAPNLTYTPTAGYGGPDSFQFTATNAGGTSAPATVSITVSPPAPVANAQSVTTPTGVATAVTLTASNAPTSYAVTTTPAHGTLSGAAPNLTYTPTAGYSGPDSFQFTATNAGGTSAPATVSITVSPLAPVANAQSVTTPTGVATAVTLTASNAPTSYAVTTTPAHGTLSGAAPNLTYTPTAGYGGPDSFQFTATNAGGTSAPATVSITVSPLAPVANAQSVTTPTGVATAVTLTASNAPTSYAVTTTPAHGTLSGAAPNLTYTPTAGYGGSDSFQFTATNAGGTSAPATVSIIVSPPGLALSPATLPGAAAGAAYSQTVSASGGTPPYGYAVTAGALPAGLTLSAAGTLSGTPTAGGSFTFTITATDATAAGGGGPYAVSRSYTLAVAAATVTLAPATLPGGTSGAAYSQTLTASGGTAPYSYAVTAGALPAGLTLSSAGVLAGTPTASGSFTFSATATDSSTGTGPYAATRSYTLAIGQTGQSITFAAPPATSVSGSPVTLMATSSSGLPVGYASNSPAVCTVNGALVTLVSPGTCSITATQGGGGAVAAAAPVTQTFTVTPSMLALTSSPPTATAVDQAYTQSNTASGGVGPYTYALASGALPPGVTLAAATGLVSGVPSVAGAFSYVVKVTDSAAAPTAATGPAVTGTIAQAANVITFPAPGRMTLGAAAVALTATASSGLAVSFASTTPATCTVAGTSVTLVAAGACSITASQAGAANFVAAAPVTQSFDIAYPAPVAGAVTAAVAYNATNAVIGLALSGGPAGSVVITTAPTHGTAIATGTTIAYTPTPGYFGPDSFAYAATGPGGTSPPATVSLTVATPPPVAVADAATTAANQAVTIPVTANDTGPLASIAVAAAPSQGSVVIQGLSATYTPAADFFGTDTFSYTAGGPGGVSTPALVTVTVTPLAVPVIPAPLTATVVAGRPLVLHPTADATGGPFKVLTITTAPAGGTAVVSGLDLVFTPASTSSGASTIGFTVSNAFGVSKEQFASVTVQPLPTPATAARTVTIITGADTSVDLTAGATGGPFTAATVVSLSPSDAGAATISQSGAAFILRFAPNARFSGTATVTYTLSNAFAVSAPATVTFVVQARPDPSANPTVTGLLNAEADTARRFARAQLTNFNQRLEKLHDRRGGAGFSNGVQFSTGFGATAAPVPGDDPLARRDANEALRYIESSRSGDPSLVLASSDAHVLGERGSSPAASSKALKTSHDVDADGKDEDWGIWTNGGLEFGQRDSQTRRKGYRFTTTGLSAGADYRFSDALTGGIGGGYGQDLNRVGRDGTKLYASTYSGAVYASYHPAEKLFLDGVLGYADLSYDLTRYSNEATALTKGKRSGNEVFGSVTAAWDYVGGDLHISPYGRWDLARADLGAYSEAGASIYSLFYRGQTVETVTGSLGARVDYLLRTSYGVWSPLARLEFSHDFQKATTQQILYADLLNGVSYLAPGDAFARNRVTLGLGADLQLHQALRFGFEYRVEAGSAQNSQSVNVKGALRF